jgi:hypothetical protein
VPDPFLNPSVRDWVASYNGSVDTTALGLAHAAGQRQVRRELYDAAEETGHVEHLAKLIAEAQWQSAGSEWRWDRLPEAKRQEWRKSAEAVILAGYVLPEPGPVPIREHQR